MALFEVEKDEAWPVLSFLRVAKGEAGPDVYSLPVYLVKEHEKLDRQLAKVHDQIMAIMEQQDDEREGAGG